ncbi:ATP-binding cassette domain-containing protein, partial [Acinetobacter baumannii]|uniref:ATP-binding cassette domain-containing protein n=1 Tax=Acinetobacter baumannii TaxID=470 RepID=UPI003891270A
SSWSTCHKILHILMFITSFGEQNITYKCCSNFLIHLYLTLGAPLATDEDILRALVVTGALSFVQEKKEGLDYLVLEGGVGFSGGQKQALLLARLLIRQPNILLLDEPTAAIDDVAEKQLIDHLKGWLAHRTLVVATHRRAVLELVDRIIVVNEGKIVMDGPRDQVLNQSTAQQKQVSQGGNS